MAASVSLSRRVIFTALNCTRYPGQCDRFRVSSFPTLRFISSTDSAYWDSTGYQATDDWKIYIQSRVRQNLVDASALSPKDLAEKVEQTMNGSVIFELKSRSEMVLEAYGKASLRYIGTQNYFLWHGEAGDEEITAWLGPECVIQSKQLERVDEFLQDYEFGHFRKRSLTDWNVSSQTVKAVLFSGGGELSSGEVEVMKAVSKEFCGRVSLGWAPANSGLAKSVFGRSRGTSFLGISAPECTAVFDKLDDPGEVVAFLDQSEKGTIEKYCVGGLKMIDARLFVGIATLVIMAPLGCLALRRFLTREPKVE
jgi:hypothetical protein